MTIFYLIAQLTSAGKIDYEDESNIGSIAACGGHAIKANIWCRGEYKLSSLIRRADTMDFDNDTEFVDTEFPRDSPHTIPYDHNVDIQQIFHACDVYLTTIRKSDKLESMSSYIDVVNESLLWASLQFCSCESILDRCSLLLLHVLQEVYELLRKYVDAEKLINLDDVGLYTESRTFLGVIPHGQMHVSLEKLAEKLDVDDAEAEQIEEYLHHIKKEIHHATKQSAPTETVLIAAEMWTNQLTGLALYISQSDMEGLKDSVKLAFENIRQLLESRRYYPLLFIFDT